MRTDIPSIATSRIRSFFPLPFLPAELSLLVIRDEEMVCNKYNVATSQYCKHVQNKKMKNEMKHREIIFLMFFYLENTCNLTTISSSF